MKIPYGDKVFSIDNTYIFRLGKVVNGNNPKFVYKCFVHNNKETTTQKYRIVDIDKLKHIIHCENDRTFMYYDNCKYVQECYLNNLGKWEIFE